MIDVPRAALRAAYNLLGRDFFSCGTNVPDPTTLGFFPATTRWKVPDAHLEDGVLEQNPFSARHRRRRRPVAPPANAQEARADIKPRHCGEHFGEPRAIAFRPTSSASIRHLLTLPRPPRRALAQPKPP